MVEMRRFLLFVLQVRLFTNASGFAPPSSFTSKDASNPSPLQVLPTCTFSTTSLYSSNSNESSNAKPIKLIGTAVLAVLTMGSLTNLVTRELPMIFTGQPDADYLGAVFDSVFAGWASQTLLLQTGALADAPEDMDSISLDGLECRLNIDVGREPGTWMDSEWAASGGRLVLPVTVKFTNDIVDLGIPGEEGMGGRYCRKLKVMDKTVSFVGPQGQVEVPVSDGGWATLPILNQKMESGERKLRFFLEFPRGAQRNDVSIPSGKVFFSSAVLPTSFDTSSLDIGDVSVIKAPNGGGILSEGGVTIKGTGGILNLWGVAGDIYLILGRYSVSKLS